MIKKSKYHLIPRPAFQQQALSSLVSVSSGLSAVVCSAVDRHLSACRVFTYFYMVKKRLSGGNVIYASCIFCIDFNFFIEHTNIFNFLIFKDNPLFGEFLTGQMYISL